MMDYWIGKYGVKGATEYYPAKDDPVFQALKNQFLAAQFALKAYMIENETPEENDDDE